MKNEVESKGVSSQVVPGPVAIGIAVLEDGARIPISRSGYQKVREPMR
jgi:hypothetical protein